jgi:hypothetical protein
MFDCFPATRLWKVYRFPPADPAAEMHPDPPADCRVMTQLTLWEFSIAGPDKSGPDL